MVTVYNVCLVVLLISTYWVVESGSSSLHKNSTNNVVKNKQIHKESDNNATNYKLRGSLSEKNGRRFLKQPANPGYEIYWSMPMVTYKGPICGQKCPEMYKHYGEICARNRAYDYKTFPNACEMLRENCDNDMGWVMTRRGECFPYWGTSEGTWDLWINKGTFPPALKEEFDKGHTIIDSLEQYKHYMYDYDSNKK